MCCFTYLYRYLRFWWTTPIYWNRLFTDTSDSFLLFSGWLLFLYGYIIFIDNSSYFAIFLHIFLFLDAIVFLVLLRKWAKRKGRILFPKMTLLHGREAQQFGVAWEEPDNPHQLPPVFFGPVMRLPQPGFQMPGLQRPPNQPHFVPPRLEYRQIQDQIYRRSRRTDRPNLQHESPFSSESTLRSTRKQTYNPRNILSSFSEQENLSQLSRTSGDQRCSLTDISQYNMPQVMIAGKQNIRVDVHASPEYSRQQIRSPYDLVNFGASTSRDTREDYAFAARSQTISLGTSYTEKDESDDSSLEIPKSISSDKTPEKDGENASDGSSFGKSESNISLRQSDGSLPEISVEQESDSRSDRIYSVEKHLVVPGSVVELDAAGEQFEIPDSSGKSQSKKSVSPSIRSSLEMHKPFECEKAAKDASVSEISKLEEFITVQTSKFKARSHKERKIPHSLKKSSYLIGDSEQPFLHKTLQITGKEKISSMSEKKEEAEEIPRSPVTTGMDKAEEISSTSEKGIDISRTHKHKDISSTPEKTKRTSSTPEKAKRTSSTPEKAKRTSSTPEKAKRTTFTPEKTKRTSSTPERTKRTSTPVKRKTETSSEDEDVSISKAKVHKQKCKQPVKIPKIEEALESDDSD